MAEFVYIHRVQPWAPPKLEPQIIWDEKMANYQFTNNKVTVVARHPLSVIQAQLTIKQLVEAFPPPENWQP